MSAEILDSIKRYRNKLVDMAIEEREEGDLLSLEVAASLGLLAVTISLINSLGSNNAVSRALIDELVDKLPSTLEEGRVNLKVAVHNDPAMLEVAKGMTGGATTTNLLGAINILYEARIQSDVSNITRMSGGPGGPIIGSAAFLKQVMFGDAMPDMRAIEDIVSKHAVNVAHSLKQKRARILDGGTADTGSSSCFIATACFDSPDQETVILFRQYRERVLKKSRIGRRLVFFYYKLSPSAASLIRRNVALKYLTRNLLSLLGMTTYTLRFLCRSHEQPFPD